MNTKRTIRKIAIAGIWMLIGGGMLTLLIAAIGRQQKDQCRDYAITVHGGAGEQLFVDQASIGKLLKAAAKGSIKGQLKSSFNLQKMEQLLEDNKWVKDAQLYFDNRNVLHVSVTERQPIARLFTTAGRSFYIDETNAMLPLSDQVSARVPVFTGFPDKKIFSARDSALLQDINNTAQFVTNNEFWNAQVAQIDIVSCGSNCWDFDMVPLVGNHIVKLGDGKDLDRKFHRLLVFYQQVISKSGFSKYKTIDVQYDGQVVAAKSLNPRIDSVQLRRNVQQLLRESRDFQNDTTTMAAVAPVLPAADLTVAPIDSDPEPIVDNKPKTSGKKPETKKTDIKRQPKAVMPKRVNG